MPKNPEVIPTFPIPNWESDEQLLSFTGVVVLLLHSQGIKIEDCTKVYELVELAFRTGCIMGMKTVLEYVEKKISSKPLDTPPPTAVN